MWMPPLLLTHARLATLEPDAAQQQGLVDAVDGFCEGIAFSPAQPACW
jgi:hypothetical protein